MGELTDLSPQDLRSAIRANPRSWSEVLNQAPGIETVRVHGITGHISRVPFGLFNAVFFPQFEEGADIDGVIDGFLEPARERGVPMVWWVDLDASPDGLESRLEAHGFRLSGHVPGMAVDLARLDDGQLPPGLEIRAAGEDVLPIWARVCRDSFGFGASFDAPMVDWMRPSLAPGSPIHPYVGYLNGEPVATSVVLDVDGVAGMYWIGTLETARRHGIGRAITLCPLLDARDRGMRVGILEASSMGISMYRRLGFEPYIELHEYVWEACEKTAGAV